MIACYQPASSCRLVPTVSPRILKLIPTCHRADHRVFNYSRTGLASGHGARTNADGRPEWRWRYQQCTRPDVSLTKWPTADRRRRTDPTPDNTPEISYISFCPPRLWKRAVICAQCQRAVYVLNRRLTKRCICSGWLLWKSPLTFDPGYDSQICPSHFSDIIKDVSVRPQCSVTTAVYA